MRFYNFIVKFYIFSIFHIIIKINIKSNSEKMNKRLIDEQFDPDFPNDHPKNLIPELCRHFYNIGWATGTGGKVLHCTM